jgi:quercetin dioxygenase-like cupin family protein/CDGSH-type Zn-finger protein
VTVQAGRTYFWCRCGRSKKQPFCDGAHKGTAFTPLMFVAGPQDEELLLCGCKTTGTAPFCDGAHTNLPGGSPADDHETAANRAVPVVTERIAGRTHLNGACYVVASQSAPTLRRGSLRYRTLVNAELGAEHQMQLLLQVDGEPSPVMAFGSSDVILFVAAGTGAVNIGGREFPVKATDGVYVRPGEAMQLTAKTGTLEVFALACPAAELDWLEEMPQAFDSNFEQRVVCVDPARRTAMGPRYFQLLVDKRIGSRVITQFIGHIPRSKAAPHRHLYEEAIIVLNGEGFMWTEDRKARVSAGDVIFLPRKQIHSLQATSADGIDVVGVICPGDNPSINYYD